MAMRVVQVRENDITDADLKSLVEVLSNDGVVCFPAENNYRLGASALSTKAVNALVAAKRRSKHAPSLVFVSGPEMLEEVADELTDLERALAAKLWPGHVTLLVKPSESFPPRVRKTLGKATGMIGVRVPAHPVARRVVEAFGRPLLVSSANLTKKRGASSPAQVRKNFGRQVEAMIDLGDLPQTKPSTLVLVSNGEIAIKRDGAVSEDTIRQAAGLA